MTTNLTDAILAARGELVRADQIVFLGFAYHEFALKRLDGMNNDVRVFGTAYGLHEGIRAWVQRETDWKFTQNLTSTADPNVVSTRCTLQNMGCEELLRHYNLLHPPSLMPKAPKANAEPVPI